VVDYRLCVWQNYHVVCSCRLHVRTRAEGLVAEAAASKLLFDYHEMAISKQL
jgi:hypothetical protein